MMFRSWIPSKLLVHDSWNQSPLSYREHKTFSNSKSPCNNKTMAMMSLQQKVLRARRQLLKGKIHLRFQKELRYKNKRFKVSRPMVMKSFRGWRVCVLWKNAKMRWSHALCLCRVMSCMFTGPSKTLSICSCTRSLLASLKLITKTKLQ